MDRSDDALFAQFSDYFKFCSRIWQQLVADFADADRRFRLTVDDSFFGESNELDAFVSVVGDLIRFYDFDVARAAEAADRIARYKKLPFPGSLGILASCVLTASRMAADDGLSASAFYPRFNRDILRRVRDNEPDRFAELRLKWIRLADFVKRAGFGSLMIPKNPRRAPMRGRPNINYPLSQCLFRRLDVEKLQPQLTEWAELELTGDAAFGKLRMHVNHFRNVSRALSFGLDAADGDPAIREAYSDALEDLLVETSRRAKSAHRIPRKKLGSELAGLARMRLKPESQAGNTVYDVVLEVETDGSWRDPDFRAETRDILISLSVEFQGRRFRYLGSDAQCFFEENDFDIVTQRTQRLPPACKIVVVTRKENLSSLVSFASEMRAVDQSIREPEQELHLLDRFSELCALRFWFSSIAIQAGISLPCFLERYSVSSPTQLNAVGGLRVTGDYVIGGAPRLELIWDSRDGEAPEVFCDEIELAGRQLADRIEFDLSDFGEELGDHYVMV